MTAKEKLIKVTSKEFWYEGLLKPSTAYTYRNRLINDKLSNEKIKELLLNLGYKPKQEELW